MTDIFESLYACVLAVLCGVLILVIVVSLWG